MTYVEYIERPSLNRTILILAMSGWPDAAEAATRSVIELVRLLPATKFASLDPEDFYDFSQRRPWVSTTPDGNRKMAWVANDFYYWQSAEHGHPGGRDILVFLGSEPHTKWRTYRDAVVAVALECKVELLLVAGSLLAQTPHTRPPRVMGSASKLNLGPGLEHIKFTPPGYEGPSSMTSVLMEAMGSRGIPQASLWGHCPHYVQMAQNPAISLALLKEVQSFLPVKLNLSRLSREAEQFQSGLERALLGKGDISAYVKRLEEMYDADARKPLEQQSSQPEPAELLNDLEEFLRQQRRESTEDSGEQKS
ncbi:MAG: PAC2 family protein [Dehalococcoidia bacterium]|nr:PAC2 family protein [Dehalococcoidia bacterium]